MVHWVFFGEVLHIKESCDIEDEDKNRRWLQSWWCSGSCFLFCLWGLQSWCENMLGHVSR